MRGIVKTVSGYVFALAMVGAALAIEVALWPLFQPSVSPLFLAAVTVAALYGGFGPGMFAAVLSALAIDYFFMTPQAPLMGLDDLVRLSVFLFVGLLINLVIEARRRANRRLACLNATLEDRVQTRTAELVRSQQALNQAERLAALGQMTAVLSHESRNALQRTLVALQMLERRLRERPDELRFVEEARRAQADLQQVYEEVREYAAPINLERRPHDLAALWREAWEELAPLRDGSAAMLVETPPSSPLPCRVDGFRIKQVFRNLLENALAASPDPTEIRIDAARHTDGQGRPVVRVSLRDNGPGLNEEQAQRIFEPFYTTKRKGTGLGMAIVQRVVEAHGGDVAIDPRPGLGLEVTIRLPAE